MYLFASCKQIHGATRPHVLPQAPVFVKNKTRNLHDWNNQARDLIT